MKFLNLGCGSHYSQKAEWTNIDFVSTGKDVIGHNLLRGIPFEDNRFDLVYHSHVLEHFSKEEGDTFISECLRVLKPGGTLRIAVPDLERIAKEYLQCLEKGLQHPEDALCKENYDWMLLEMYEQTVRNQKEGAMAKYFSREIMINEEFIFGRIGEDGRAIRNYFLSVMKNKPQAGEHGRPKNVFGLKTRLKNYLLRRWNIDLHAHEIGKFRLEGEIHQWMYDRYSLSNWFYKVSCG